MTSHSIPTSNTVPGLIQLQSKIANAALASSQGFWQRILEIDGRYARQACDDVWGALKDVRGPAELALGVDAFFRRYAVEIAMTPGLSVERFVRSMQGWDDATPQTVTVDGKPIMLPARVRDASQGFGVYSVPYAKAKALVPDAFRPLSLGGQRAAAALFIVDYRESDLGAYYEVGLSVYVTPNGLRWIVPGTFTHTLIVNDRFSRDAGRQIWGYPKTVAEIDVSYTDKMATCTLGPPSNPVLSLSFCRGGRSATTNIPLYTYTVHETRPTLTLFTRTGRGERTRFNGDGVRIHTGGDNGLAGLIEDLEIPDKPLLWSWTDNMQGSFGIPHML
ncbi:MAG: acetoacetate decarboxylase family protein [Gammaproteobacteria bacterium]